MKKFLSKSQIVSVILFGLSLTINQGVYAGNSIELLAKDATVKGNLKIEDKGSKDVRIKKNIDFDWKFIQSDDESFSQVQIQLDTAVWKDVQLPHDWNITMNFDRQAGGAAAYLPGTVGWYRRELNIPKNYSSKKTSILFDGIFNKSKVYINGNLLGFRPYGFCSIEYDLTPYLNFGGKNIIAVRVDCTGERPRWYAGSGIYRHVWLNIVNPIHIPTYGTYVTTSAVNEQSADIQAVTTVKNLLAETKKITIMQIIVDNSSKEIARFSTNIEIAASDSSNITQNTQIRNPALWSIQNPALYTLITTITENGKMIDNYSTNFGIRSFEFTSDKGFFLNDKPVKLKGMCLHQDGGILGAAVPMRAYERQLQIIKEYGCNAVRCAHNPPSPEFLDLCDRMGFIVIDEAFDKWKSGYYAEFFDEWWQRDLENMLLRDRNHPSVMLWSIGNELQEAWNIDDEGVERAQILNNFVHKTEPGRPTVLSAQNNHQTKFAGVTDVTGYNYLEARAVSDHINFPQRRIIITEELPYYSGEEGNIRSYSTNNPWNTIVTNDFIAGGFIWSGVDYLGEATYPGKGWPNGLFDICMNEKPRAAFHRAMWNNKPMVRMAVRDNALDIEHGRDLWQWPKMASHWNFPDSYQGMIMEVLTTTNCESVELYMNDKLMGKRRTDDFPNHTIVWNVPYSPGELIAKAYNGNKEAAQYRITTTGNTARAILTPDHSEIHADGYDLSYISVTLEDEKGNSVQTDDREITVTVTGEGKFMGMMNADLRRDNSFQGNKLKTYFGKALIVVQSTRKAGEITVEAKIEGNNKTYKVKITTK
ncbi:MAG: DUF4982 domain-containing protein [Tannerella sp.]|jgi:beta-galactosidase|nr:DUF4982 domain-containing protein [Tannerella sp.]